MSTISHLCFILFIIIIHLYGSIFFLSRFVLEIKQSILPLKHGFWKINSQNRRFVNTACHHSTQCVGDFEFLLLLNKFSYASSLNLQVAKLSLQTGFISEYTRMVLLETDHLKKVKESAGTKEVCIPSLHSSFSIKQILNNGFI